MAEAAVDTQTPPADPGQVSEPTGQQTATTDGGDGGTPPAEPTAPAQPTAEELSQQAEERAFQRFASWQGRREKGLLESVGQMLDSRLSRVPPQAPPPTSQPQTIDAATLLDKPVEIITQVLQEKAPNIIANIAKAQSQAEQQFTQSVIKGAADIMMADPLFADQAFGNDVVNEIKNSFGSIRRDLPTEVASQLLVNSAVANVYRKNKAPANGLSGNRPATVPLGGVKPPPATPPKAPPVKLSAEAKALAERFGYKDEDLAKVFKEA